MLRPILATCYLLALSTALSAQSNGTPTAPPATPERSASGAYTDDQAARGKTAYDSYCISCHTTDFHTDEAFKSSWMGRTVYDLFKRLKTTMPDDNPGGLSDDEYARIIAYILKLNGFQPGTDSLSTDTTAMKLIRMKPAAPDTTRHP